MNYKLRYSPAAVTDMDDVWNDVFEASASYETSDRYTEDFASAISNMRAFPESGIPLSYQGLFTGFYSVNFKAYKAFYRVNGSYIEVLRILLAKRDYISVLFSEEE